MDSSETVVVQGTVVSNPREEEPLMTEESESKNPPLAEMVERFRQDYGLGAEATMAEVVDEVCRELSIAPTLPLVERAQRCYDVMYLGGVAPKGAASPELATIPPSSSWQEATSGYRLGNFETGATFDLIGKSFAISLRFRMEAKTGGDPVVLWLGQQSARNYQEGRDKYFQFYDSQLHWADGSGGDYPRVDGLGTSAVLDGQFHTLTYRLDMSTRVSTILFDGATRESKTLSASDASKVGACGTIKLGSQWWTAFTGTLVYLHVETQGRDVARYDFFRGPQGYCALGESRGDTFQPGFEGCGDDEAEPLP